MCIYPDLDHLGDCDCNEATEGFTETIEADEYTLQGTVTINEYMLGATSYAFPVRLDVLSAQVGGFQQAQLRAKHKVRANLAVFPEDILGLLVTLVTDDLMAIRKEINMTEDDLHLYHHCAMGSCTEEMHLALSGFYNEQAMDYHRDFDFAKYDYGTESEYDSDGGLISETEEDHTAEDKRDRRGCRGADGDYEDMLREFIDEEVPRRKVRAVVAEHHDGILFDTLDPYDIRALSRWLWGTFGVQLLFINARVDGGSVGDNHLRFAPMCWLHTLARFTHGRNNIEGRDPAKPPRRRAAGEQYTAWSGEAFYANAATPIADEDLGGLTTKEQIRRMSLRTAARRLKLGPWLHPMQLKGKDSVDGEWPCSVAFHVQATGEEVQAWNRVLVEGRDVVEEPCGEGSDEDTGVDDSSDDDDDSDIEDTGDDS